MIIIYGTRNLTKNVGGGDFHCHHCYRQAGYTLIQSRQWATLYFIPVFPVGGAERVVQCEECGSLFKEAILDAAPPAAQDKELALVYREMEEGLSLEAAEDRLCELGLDPDDARDAVTDMADGDHWRCKSCKKHYLGVVRECKRCERS
jgi:hypothetical protein